MHLEKKYALLDTDFIYKTHLARNKNNITLAEIVIKFEDYEFFCHEMIREELTRHKIVPDPNPWLDKLIKENKIKLYKDQDILRELSVLYGDNSKYAYLNLLKISCDTFNAGFFDEYYGMLEKNIDNILSSEEFLDELKKCDNNIPHQQGLGEKKTYVLVQMLQIFYSNQIYVFCSDDFKARQSIASLTRPVNCLGVLAIFYKLMKMGYSKKNMQEFYDRLSGFLKNQTHYKVWSDTGYQRIRVPVSQVLDDIYANKFQLLKNGDLKYKTYGG